MQPMMFEQTTRAMKSAMQTGLAAMQHAFAGIEKISALHWETTKAAFDEAGKHDTASAHPVETSLNFNRIAIEKLMHYGAHTCAIARDVQAGYLDALRSHVEMLDQQWAALNACMMPVHLATQTASVTNVVPKTSSSVNKPAA
ncbi:hypothetical protein WI25_35410 [Burkholderia cepacia]|uniref:hypothetical protein n=1 Tax=Burkholderia cepacia TaxID=292 RepID=UPI0007584D6F|nr:hypothetical protein [Burkholderia cepacia]KUY84952.1 hypothetical protein WI25_35410 [Burkholderia cepacia]